MHFLFFIRKTLTDMGRTYEDIDMEKVICDKCSHELFTITPELWESTPHVGCGGKYIKSKSESQVITEKVKTNGGIVYDGSSIKKNYSHVMNVI